MSVEQQAIRVASGAKSALKALIQKLGGTVSDTTKIDGYADIIDAMTLASGGGADLSLGLAGVSKWQSPIIKAVDSDGKPTEWEAAALAKADGSNIPNSLNVQDTWRDRIAALPGIKLYGKANAKGKIMAYTDAACTQDANYTVALELQDYGNALLIYNHKTYQCVGFSELSSSPGAFVVAHFSRAEIVTADNTPVYHVEHAVFDLMNYLSGTIDAPIKITAGDIPLTNITTI